jgi:hypothetical protein
MAVSVLVSWVGNGIPRKLGFVVLVDKKITGAVLKATDTWIESPNFRGLPHVVGGVKVPVQVAVPAPRAVPLLLTLTVSEEPQFLVIVGDPFSTM